MLPSAAAKKFDCISSLNESPASGELPYSDPFEGVHLEGELEAAEKYAVHPDEQEVAVVAFHRDERHHRDG